MDDVKDNIIYMCFQKTHGTGQGFQASVSLAVSVKKILASSAGCPVAVDDQHFYSKAAPWLDHAYDLPIKQITPPSLTHKCNPHPVNEKNSQHPCAPLTWRSPNPTCPPCFGPCRRVAGPHSVPFFPYTPSETKFVLLSTALRI